jgi:hypothetical protein
LASLRQHLLDVVVGLRAKFKLDESTVHRWMPPARRGSIASHRHKSHILARTHRIENIKRTHDERVIHSQNSVFFFSILTAIIGSRILRLCQDRPRDDRMLWWDYYQLRQQGKLLLQ